jgi:hypothetical protein
MDDEKYRKRRIQTKRTQQQHHVMLLVLFTCCVVMYTWWSLSDDLQSHNSIFNVNMDPVKQRKLQDLMNVHQQRLPGRPISAREKLERGGGEEQPMDGGSSHGRMNKNKYYNRGSRGGVGGGDDRGRGGTNNNKNSYGGASLENGAEDNNNSNKSGPGGFLRNMLQGVVQPDPVIEELERRLDELTTIIQENHKGEIQWIKPHLLISMDPLHPNPLLEGPGQYKTHHGPLMNASKRNALASLFASSSRTGLTEDDFFRIKRRRLDQPMAWELEAAASATDHHQGQPPPPPPKGPTVDYTKHIYEYPQISLELPTVPGTYPPLRPLQDVLDAWPQDDLDHPPTPFHETLYHFDYSNPQELKAAAKFRDAKLPFKLYNVPEVTAATAKWTDEYLAMNFDEAMREKFYTPGQTESPPPLADGSCQESRNNFFAFFTPSQWDLEQMGIPPTRNNDFTFTQWAQHARYADAVGLEAEQPHFYFQAGVDRSERKLPRAKWTFISRDLPSFSSPTETFFVFHPEEQKGIQCRFGERGVTAATHFDSGRNMVGMMTGAKRYILSPPKECGKLGIVTGRGNTIYRHSLLNFGHLNYLHDTTILDNPDNPISSEERAWLERSGQAMAVDTVLKAGEVLYIPSHWFHYITSLQKSAQCNVRSGIDSEGDDIFGGKEEVTALCLPWN